MLDKSGDMFGHKESNVSSKQDYSWIKHLQVTQKAVRKRFIIIVAA